MSKHKVDQYETVSLSILPCPRKVECAHRDAMFQVLETDGVYGLNFNELANLGDYVKNNGMIEKGEQCLEHHVRHNGVDYKDYTNIKIHALLYTLGYLEED